MCYVIYLILFFHTNFTVYSKIPQQITYNVKKNRLQRKLQRNTNKRILIIIIFSIIAILIIIYNLNFESDQSKQYQHKIIKTDTKIISDFTTNFKQKEALKEFIFATLQEAVKDKKLNLDELQFFQENFFLIYSNIPNTDGESEQKLCLDEYIFYFRPFNTLNFGNNDTSTMNNWNITHKELIDKALNLLREKINIAVYSPIGEHNNVLAYKIDIGTTIANYINITEKQVFCLDIYNWKPNDCLVNAYIGVIILNLIKLMINQKDALEIFIKNILHFSEWLKILVNKKTQYKELYKRFFTTLVIFTEEEDLSINQCFGFSTKITTKKSVSIAALLQEIPQIYENIITLLRIDNVLGFLYNTDLLQLVMIYRKLFNKSIPVFSTILNCITFKDNTIIEDESISALSINDNMIILNQNKYNASQIPKDPKKGQEYSISKGWHFWAKYYFVGDEEKIKDIEILSKYFHIELAKIWNLTHKIYQPCKIVEVKENYSVLEYKKCEFVKQLTEEELNRIKKLEVIKVFELQNK